MLSLGIYSADNCHVLTARIHHEIESNSYLYKLCHVLYIRGGGIFINLLSFVFAELIWKSYDPR